MQVRLFDLDLAPSWGHFKADPMCPVEIDEHADSDRIWATIEHMKSQVAEEIAYLREEISVLEARISDIESDSLESHMVIELQNAFRDLVSPKGLTKKNLSRFEQLFHMTFGVLERVEAA